MMTGLHLAKDLTLPAEVAGRRTAIFGISGSGKSNSASVLIEGLLHAGEQVVCIDPKGEGWGLLSRADGAPSNLPMVVFGEPNGHIESLSEHHGPQLADFVVDTGQSVVLSLLGFDSDQAERRFVSTFLRQLYKRKSRQGHPSRTLVVLDEAHLFIPENVRGDAAELAGAAQRIARQGRTFGIGTLIVDQRPQDVSKRVITQCDTLICHQLTHKLDRDALRDWVRGYDVDGRGEQFLESLASLEPGEAWVWSPGWLKLFKRIKVNRRKTYDSGAAPDGSASAQTLRRAEVDLEALRGQLSAVVERAKESDPKELRKKIAELQKQLAARPAETVRVEVPVPVEVPVLKNGQLDRTEKILARLEDFGQKALAESAELRRLIAPAAAPRPVRPPVDWSAKPGQTPAPGTVAPPKAQRAKPVAEAPSGELTKTQQRILDTVLMLNRRGIVPSRDSVARWQAIHPNGGRYGSDLALLRAAGYLDGMMLTQAGVEAAREQTTGFEAAQAAVDSTKARLLRTVADAGRSLSREELAELLGIHPNGGRYGSDLAWLRTMGLLTERGPIALTAGAIA